MGHRHSALINLLELALATDPLDVFGHGLLLIAVTKALVSLDLRVDVNTDQLRVVARIDSEVPHWIQQWSSPRIDVESLISARGISMKCRRVDWLIVPLARFCAAAIASTRVVRLVMAFANELLENSMIYLLKVAIIARILVVVPLGIHKLMCLGVDPESVSAGRVSMVRGVVLVAINMSHAEILKI